MDFVDLDKVLDEFEEEEKAADSLTPGQEVKPSGYSDFVESRRDKPWESVSEVPVSGLRLQLGYGVSGKGSHGGGMYDYDIPYDATGTERSRNEYIDQSRMPDLQKNVTVTNIEFGKGDLNLSNSTENSMDSGSKFDSLQYEKNNLHDKEADLISRSNDLYIEPKPVLTVSSSGEALKEHLNNAEHDVNYADFGSSVYSRHNGIVHEDFKSAEKGIKASQVIAVQTDALTPRIEKELSSVPFPKSDIKVDGHGVSQVDIIVSRQDNSWKDFSSVQNSVSVAPIQPDPYQHSGNTNVPYAKFEPVVSKDNQPDIDIVYKHGQEATGIVSDQPAYNSVHVPDVGSSVNGHGRGEGSSQPELPAAVGFDSVTDDIDDEEVDQYLNDAEALPKLQPETEHQNQNTHFTDNDGQNHMLSNQVIQNPDIVLDVGRSESFKPEQGRDVQYSGPPVPSETRLTQPLTDTVMSNFLPSLILAQNRDDETMKSEQWQSDTTVCMLPSDMGTEQTISSEIVPQSGALEASPVTRMDKEHVCDKQASSEDSSLSETGRESSSGGTSESSSSPSDQGSPQMLGVGARPKDPAAVKKNRPNSLLGLSKVGVDPSFNIVHEVVEKTDTVSSMSGLDGSLKPETSQTVDANVMQSQNNLQEASENPVGVIQQGVEKPFFAESLTKSGGEQESVAPHVPSVEQKHMTNMEIRQQIEQEQRQRMNAIPGGQQSNQLTAQPEAQPNVQSNVQPNVQSDVQSDVQLDFQQVDPRTGGEVFVGEMTATGVGETMDDMPVMRRGEEQLNQPGLDVQSGIPPRPHSWSPGSGQIAPPGKLKRPTSLNLPPRGEFGVAGDRSPDMGGRMRGIGMMKGEDIPEETEQSVGEEYSEGDDGMMEAAGISEDDMNFPSSNDPPPQSIIHSHLGRVAPTWVPDNEAPNCMQCQCRFTFTKRRHHCRACGKVFCSTCCSLKTSLAYMDMKEARVCQQCHQILQSADWSSTGGSSRRSPNPNNPSEYCSTIPPQQQANARAPLPTVLVPVGVLKREGSQRRTEPKQVMFSDGIRPGGDLTELDGSNETRLPPRRMGRVQKKVEKTPGGQSSPKTRRLRATENARNRSLIPEEGLPPLYTITEKGDVSLDIVYNPDTHLPQMKDEEAEPVIFAINSNLQVLVKVLLLDCCVNRECWSFTTRGLCTVGQEEVVTILECFPDENRPPRDIFCHLATVYEEAGKGNTVSDMGHTIFNQSFLDSRDHGGFLYLRATFQCLQKLQLPPPPYLFGILLQKWETPWAKVFPLRLLLRLGAEYRYYPCPLVSIRNRKPVFFEIGHTIMNLLADFRNYQYMLPQIKGVHIHMEDKKTVINFPRNRYDELMKMVNSSNEHVMALGSNFSPDADSHLVCIQNDEGNYQTQAINIQNKPRKVTGASFVVFNGALKTSSGLRAKSSIVEDGLMVQILPESMLAVKQAIKDMTDYSIGCGSVTVDKPEEVVVLQWVNDDKNVNIGVKSPIDKMALDGVESIHIHNSTDYVGENRAIRWTEVFFIQNEDSGARWEPVDLSRLAETLASATCIALSQHLDRLKEAGMTKIGLRVTIDTEQVGYEIGSNNEKLADFYMNDLDNGLIPVIHGAASQNQEGPIVLELFFYILE